MQPVKADYAAWRHVPFGGGTGDADIFVLGRDISDAGFAMQVRAMPGDTGAALVALANAAAGAQGVSAVFDPAYPDPVTSLIVGATRIRPQIDQGALEAIPVNPADPAARQLLVFDLRVTEPGLPAYILRYGAFILSPGVTI